MARKNKAHIDTAQLAYARAAAWALSVPGTPYGVTQPVIVPGGNEGDPKPANYAGSKAATFQGGTMPGERA